MLETNTGEHVLLAKLGLRQRTLRALAHADIFNTADVAATPLNKLMAVHGLSFVGLTATLYLMAARGLPHPDMEAAEPRLRILFQHIWETDLGELST